MEDRLISGLAGGNDVDGHDVGGGAMHVFIFTADAVAAFSRAQNLVGDHSLAADMKAGYRSADADEYTPLWPPELKEFRIVV